MGECNICCEKYTKQVRFQVTCPKCEYETCRQCIQTYLLDTTQDPHCMSCKVAWNQEFLDHACTKAFRLGNYKKHRENILFERQKCLMPGTQDLVRRTIEARDSEKEEIRLQREIDILRRRLHDQRDETYRLRYNVNHGGGSSQPKREFVRKCPIEDCKGFLSTQWKCGICKENICKDCNEVNGEGHECDPAAKATVELLKKDTKPCPKCGTMIFKISGCSQMWCPECHVAFNWNTLQIETGIIHNPHFYEFQRTHGTIGGGRNVGDIPCGGLPSIAEINGCMEIPHDVKCAMLKVHRAIVHIERVEIPFIPHNEPNHTRLRVQYMMNELSEEDFKKQMQRNEKHRNKGRDMLGVYQMFVNTTSDILRQVVVNELHPREGIVIINRLIEYFNSTMNVIGKRYNQATASIIDYGTVIST